MKVIYPFLFIFGFLFSALLAPACKSSSSRSTASDTVVYIGLARAVCSSGNENTYPDTVTVVKDNSDSITFYYKQLDCELLDQYSHLWVTYQRNDSEHYISSKTTNYISFSAEFRILSNDSIRLKEVNNRKVSGTTTAFSFSGKKQSKPSGAD